MNEQPRFFLATLCALAGTLAPSALAGDYYVDSAQGSDLLGDGSAGSPWQTLTFGVGQLPGAGHQVHVAPGTHDAALGEIFPIAIPAGVYVSGAGNSSTVFDGGATGTLFQIEGHTLGGGALTASLAALQLSDASIGVEFVPNAVSGDGEGLLSELSFLNMASAGLLSPAFFAPLGLTVEDSEFQLCDVGIQASSTGTTSFVRALRCEFSSCLEGVQVTGFSPGGPSTSATAMLVQCKVRNCTTGVFVWGEQPAMANASLSGSLVSQCTTGIEVQDLGDASLLGSTVAGNGEGVRAGGTYPELVAYFLENAIVWGNTAGDLDASAVLSSKYSNAPVALPGPGNQSVDPQFVDAAGGDYHLAAGSPMIDAGLPTTPPGGVDGDTDPRLLDGDLNGSARVDIGWDEHNQISVALSGSAIPGASFDVVTTTPMGFLTCVALGFAEADVSFGQPGSALIDPSTYFLLASGADSLTVPVFVPSSPQFAGLPLHFQSFAVELASGWATFSNRATTQIQ